MACSPDLRKGFLFMAYSDLLKDPRRQKRRLEILERDKFTCQVCGSTTKTLHVHHIWYYSGMMPWQYSGDLLITLCLECHESEENKKKERPEHDKHVTRSHQDLILAEFMVTTWHVGSAGEVFNGLIEFLRSKQK